MDVAIEGLLHLKVLRSPHAHARILAHRPRQGAWRCRAWSRSSPGRTCRAGSTAPRRTRTIWSIRTTPTFSTTSCASSASAIAAVVAETEAAAEAACRLLDVDLRDPAGGVRSGRGHGAGCADPARQGRGGEGQHLRRHPRRGRQRGGRLRGRRRRARDDLFHLARSARASGDARLDRLARRRRPAACAHQLAGAVHRQAEALPSLRPARRATCMSSPSASAAASAASRR